MEVKLSKDREIIEEALEILAEYMEASKVVYLLSLLQSGQDNYLEIRERLFAGETVESLAQKVEAYQQNKTNS
jgi:hypothetical protein